MRAHAWPTCATCAYWQVWEADRAVPRLRQCVHPKMRPQYRPGGDHLPADAAVLVSSDGDGAFYPGPAFGCCHHTGRQ